MQMSVRKKCQLPKILTDYPDSRSYSTYTAANLDTTIDYKTSILACLMHEIRSIKDQRVAYLKPLNSTYFMGSISGYYLILLPALKTSLLSIASYTHYINFIVYTNYVATSCIDTAI